VNWSDFQTGHLWVSDSAIRQFFGSSEIKKAAMPSVHSQWNGDLVIQPVQRWFWSWLA